MNPEELASMSRQDKEILLVMLKANLNNLQQVLQTGKMRGRWETAETLSRSIEHAQLTIRQVEKSLET